MHTDVKHKCDWWTARRAVALHPNQHWILNSLRSPDGLSLACGLSLSIRFGTNVLSANGGTEWKRAVALILNFLSFSRVHCCFIQSDRTTSVPLLLLSWLLDYFFLDLNAATAAFERTNGGNDSNNETWGDWMRVICTQGDMGMGRRRAAAAADAEEWMDGSQNIAVSAAQKQQPNMKCLESHGSLSLCLVHNAGSKCCWECLCACERAPDNKCRGAINDNCAWQSI